MHLQPIRGTHGMVTAPHALAAQSGQAVLRDGGNAIEAMVAMAATIAVVYPHMNSIGGDGFWLVAQPGQAPIAIDACGAAGAGASMAAYRAAGLSSIPFRGGRAACTVAGTVSGWAAALELAQSLGARLPLSRLLADAIGYARDGFPITESQVAAMDKLAGDLLPVSGYAQSFQQAGAMRTGERLRLPRLAQTLEQLVRAGLDDFYRGDLARSLAKDLAAQDSPVTLADLQAHQAQRKTPLSLRQADWSLFNMPPPTQGLVALLILGQLERLWQPGMTSESPAFVHACVEATKQAFRIRDRVITDPAYMTEDPADYLQPARLDAMAAKILPGQAAPWGRGRGPGDTVWMGAVDGQGLAVSFIQSVYHEFGSGLVLADSGICWQNRGCSFSLSPEARNPLMPGRKPYHTLIPGLARFDDGRTLVYGNMGGDGQPQSQAAVFSRIARLGLNPQDAIAAPRWLLGRTWGQSSDSLKLESRFPEATVQTLRDWGHEVDVLGAFDETMGHAGAIVRHPDGLLEGGFDLRSDGIVAGW